ncbi:histidine phosphatase family protein [Candidatus Pacearchaeota archaeon]|nr:histidine phosphatase family protein [Candidatus Pacearchaeota archaeon]
MKIYLIQPGENDSSNLTKNGERGLYSLARKLINDKVQIERVYVNGYNISRQSGKILSNKLEVPIISDERFFEVKKEFILGDVQGDIENLENINLFIDEIVSKGKNVIITIGGGIHRIIISKLTGMSLQETRHFSFKPAGISILYYDNTTGRWRINSLNDVNHLRIP